MSLTRLIYFSEYDRSKSLDLEELLSISRRNNRQVNVTGFLFFDGYYFVQALEGERVDISNTYHRIVTDDRHRNIILITSSEIRTRLFAGWAMGLHEGLNMATREALLSVFSLGTLDPGNITVEDTQYFLQTLARKMQEYKLTRLKE
ncbi:MAG: BLUF domain-containing protein [Rhodomicrobium sp.]|nr:BLUF domain-containing protein [Rhodomicrobium sp.]